MNKLLKIAGVIAVFVAVIVFAGATVAFAQGPNQPDGITSPRMNGAGNGAGQGLGLLAVDEADMHAAIAGALGLGVEEFEAALAAGKTPVLLAQERGVDLAEVRAAMDAVHAEALAQAVAEGLISQEQADWILSHRGGGNGQGLGSGRMGGAGTGFGGRGGYGGECPYQTS